MDASRVARVREDMERADARRLQPHYIESFFLEAFSQLGGTARQREPRRYEVTHVPAPVRNRDRLIGTGEPVLPRYERIAFEKSLIAPQGEPLAAFVCPGHPLLDATLDLTLDRHRDLLRRGTVLVDEQRSRHDAARALLPGARHPGRELAQEWRPPHDLQADALCGDGCHRPSPPSPLRALSRLPPPAADEPGVDVLLARPESAWITRDLEQKALAHAIAEVVPEHLKEVRDRRSAWIDKARAAVKDRLTKEIGYWDHRAEDLKLQEQAGKPNARLNSQEASRRADDLQARLQKRMEQLDLEAQVSALPPVALGGFVVVPAGLIAQMTGRPLPKSTQAVDTQASAARARAIILEVERQLGFEPTDREFEKLGYDIESRDASTGRLRFLEVKGRVSGAATITVTKNEILYSLNKPEDFILAIVEFLEKAHTACTTCGGPSSVSRISGSPVSTTTLPSCLRRARHRSDAAALLLRTHPRSRGQAMGPAGGRSRSCGTLASTLQAGAEPETRLVRTAAKC